MSDENAVKPTIKEQIEAAAIDTVWTIGHSADGVYFLSEQWPNGGGSLSWHDTLLDCVEDMRRRIES